MIKQIVCACLFGVCALSYYIQQDTWCRNRIAEYITAQLQESLLCVIEQYTVKDLSLLNGSITFADITVRPHGECADDWRLRADSCTLSISWKELLLYGTLDLDISGARVHMHSLCRGKHVLLYEHI